MLWPLHGDRWASKFAYLGVQVEQGAYGMNLYQARDANGATLVLLFRYNAKSSIAQEGRLAASP